MSEEKWPSIRDKDAPHKKVVKKPNKKYTDSPKGDFYAPSIGEGRSYEQFMEEKLSDEKARSASGGSVRQGNRLPLKDYTPMERRKKGESAASDSPKKMKGGQGRQSTVKQPKDHLAAKRNQAYGGESEEQYNPPKYRKIKNDLRKKGGQVMVPGKPPYQQQRRKPDNVVRGAELADKIDKALKGDSGKDAVRKLKNKALENAFKKDAKGYPKIEEEMKRKPLDKMLMKAFEKDMRAEKEPDEGKKRKLEDQARMIQMNAYESKEYDSPTPYYDPLDELYNLWESEVNYMEKPDLSNSSRSFAMGTPQTGDYEHPVIQSRNNVDRLRQQGVPIEIAHQAVKGNVDTGNIQSKADLASTLGRVQDGDQHSNLMVDKNAKFKSVMATDAAIEKQLDQVTRNDLRTPMASQVPDYQQTPSQEVAEEVDISDEYDYNDDVAYLQTYGRA